MYLQQSNRLVQTGSVIVSHGSMDYAAQSRLVGFDQVDLFHIYARKCPRVP